MSNSEILLTVVADGQVAEIFVVDGHFTVVGRGLGIVEISVPPGIYRAKARVGTQQSEKLFWVEPNPPLNRMTVKLDEVKFPSAIPLEGTSTTHEYHQSALNQILTERVNLGSGAGLIILIRDPSTVYFQLDPAGLDCYAANFHDFILSDWEGINEHPLEQLGKVEAGQGYLVLNASIAPGTYALSRPTGKKMTGRQFLPLVVPAGWTLQVYISMDQVGDDGLQRQANFDEAAMVLDRDIAFDPFREDLKVLEVARSSLTRGHNCLGKSDMNRLLSGKFENPMMGILSAHLLLLDKKPDLDLVGTVITNTSNLLGSDYPDLLALSWKLRTMSSNAEGRQDQNAASAILQQLKAPPLLQLSWHYLMEAYRTAPIVSFNPALRHLASRLISSSVWLRWTNYPKPLAEVGDSLTGICKPYSNRPRLDMLKVFDITKYTLDKMKDRLNDLGVLLTPMPPHDESRPELLKEAKVGDSLTFGQEHLEDMFRLLVREIDWVAVIRLLKKQNLSAESPNVLSVLQTQLLLFLKAAREQFIEEQEISEESVVRWLSTFDIPVESLLKNVQFLGTFADQLLTALGHGRSIAPR